MMKKILFLSLVFLLAVGVTAALATVANTKHNLTETSTTTGAKADAGQGATLCGFCHVPHGGNISVAGLPLWARTTRDTAASPYQLYGGGATLAGTVVAQPGAFSLTCLSCHDGTISVGVVYKYGVATTYTMTDSTAPNYLNASDQLIFIAGNSYQPNIGGTTTDDLRDDHPVGFTFPAAGYGAGGGIPGIGRTIVTVGAANFIDGAGATNYPVYQYPGLNDRFECSTCHDPHAEDTAQRTKFLRFDNAGLCQDCHDLK